MAIAAPGAVGCVTLNRKSAISPLPAALVRSAKEEVEPRNGSERPLGGHLSGRLKRFPPGGIYIARSGRSVRRST